MTKDQIRNIYDQFYVQKTKNYNDLFKAFNFITGQNEKLTTCNSCVQKMRQTFINYLK